MLDVGLCMFWTLEVLRVSTHLWDLLELRCSSVMSGLGSLPLPYSLCSFTCSLPGCQSLLTSCYQHSMQMRTPWEALKSMNVPAACPGHSEAGPGREGPGMWVFKIPNTWVTCSRQEATWRAQSSRTGCKPNSSSRVALPQGRVGTQESI